VGFSISSVVPMQPSVRQAGRRLSQ
jgi:hypothetical protein